MEEDINRQTTLRETERNEEGNKEGRYVLGSARVKFHHNAQSVVKR